jgi:copper resistance protein C
MWIRLAIAAVGLVGATTLRHTHLVKSSPAAGDTVRVAPREIHLWFSERPEVPFTSVTLLGTDSVKLAVGKTAAAADSLEVAVPLPAELAPGNYTVLWRTASQDGHAARGRFEFTVVR